MKSVPVASTTLANLNTKQVYEKDSNDKRTITTTLTVKLKDPFLGVQLIYGGKTNQGLPDFKTESIKFINEILVTYI